MTKIHVHVVLGTLPPLIPVQLAHTQKFDTVKEAKKWVEKFQKYVSKQKRTREYIQPTQSEIKFHGGLHLGIYYEGMSAVTVVPIEEPK